MEAHAYPFRSLPIRGESDVYENGTPTGGSCQRRSSLLVSALLFPQWKCRCDREPRVPCALLGLSSRPGDKFRVSSLSRLSLDETESEFTRSPISTARFTLISVHHINLFFCFLFYLHSFIYCPLRTTRVLISTLLFRLYLPTVLSSSPPWCTTRPYSLTVHEYCGSDSFLPRLRNFGTSHLRNLLLSKREQVYRR